MDIENFEYVIDARTVSMSLGELNIDGSDYDKDDSPEVYALAIRVARVSGCFSSDAGVPSVVVDIQ